MFCNLLKTLNKTYNKSIITFSTRYLTPYADTKQIEDKEEEAALKIEASFFENSSVKHEPLKSKDILYKPKQKHHKKQSTSNNIVRRPQTFETLKNTRAQREAESQFIKDQELGLEFLKLSLNDPRLSTLLTTVRSKKRRDKDRQIIIEGRRLIREALTCSLKLNSIIFSQKEELANIKENIVQAQKEFNTKIYKVPHHDLKTWSTLTTPPGVMAIFERPSLTSVVDNVSASTTPLPITVVCDNIREPNNLGSIIRSCAALPCRQVVVTRGCCDPWESKVLRGGCGGHFRVAIRDDVEWAEVPLMIPPEEADNCYIFVAENNIGKFQSKKSFVEYSELEKTGLHNVVVIGGETHGVGEDAYRFMKTVGQRGKSLYIPLAEGIDSLNVASALTLILYELRKNILNSKK